MSGRLGIGPKHPHPDGFDLVVLDCAHEISLDARGIIGSRFGEHRSVRTRCTAPDNAPAMASQLSPSMSMSSSGVFSSTIKMVRPG